MENPTWHQALPYEGTPTEELYRECADLMDQLDNDSPDADWKRLHQLANHLISQRTTALPKTLFLPLTPEQSGRVAKAFKKLTEHDLHRQRQTEREMHREMKQAPQPRDRLLALIRSPIIDRQKKEGPKSPTEAPLILPMQDSDAKNAHQPPDNQSPDAAANDNLIRKGKIMRRGLFRTIRKLLGDLNIEVEREGRLHEYVKSIQESSTPEEAQTVVRACIEHALSQRGKKKKRRWLKSALVTVKIAGGREIIRSEEAYDMEEVLLRKLGEEEISPEPL